jgi:hypothetical protein
MYYVQHHEVIYWCPAPLQNEDQCSYKVHSAADVQVAPPPPIKEYIFDSTVGSDDEAPVVQRASFRVAAPQHTRQATGKMLASRATATIAATQAAEAKKKRKRTRSMVSVDTTTVSSDVKTTEVDDEEGDAESPGATGAPSAGTPHRVTSMEERVVETSRWTSAIEECPRSIADTVGDPGSRKRAMKAPPKPCKPDLMSATK